MREGRAGEKAGNISDELRSAVLGLESRRIPRTRRPSRSSRISAVLEAREGIPSILWVVLVLGGVVTVLFACLLGIRPEGIHAFMIAAYTVVLALILYAVWALDYPFDGLVQISPDALEAALSRMKFYREQ